MRRWALLLSLLLFPRVGLAANTLAVTYFESSTKVAELEDERLAAIADAVGRSGFAIETVSLEILGHCARCSKDASPRNNWSISATTWTARVSPPIRIPG